MLARVRVALPDRPGALGLVASALGRAGADIVQVEVLECGAGRALDDVVVQVRAASHLDAVRRELAAVRGAEVVGVQQDAPPATGHTELELVANVLAQPSRGLRTLVDGAPPAVGADWGAAVLHDGTGAPVRVLAASAAAPEPADVPLVAPLRLGALRWPGAAGAAVVPLEGWRASLLLVRERGPAFHRSELWRLEQVGRIVGPVLAGAESAAESAAAG